MSQFDRVIQEFHQRRLEKELKTYLVREERTAQLRELALLADQEMRQRKSRRQYFRPL